MPRRTTDPQFVIVADEGVPEEMFEQPKPYREPPPRPMLHRVITKLQPWLSAFFIFGLYRLLSRVFGLPTSVLGYIGFALTFSILAFVGIWVLRLYFEPTVHHHGTSGALGGFMYISMVYVTVFILVIALGALLIALGGPNYDIHVAANIILGLANFLYYLFLRDI